MSKRAEKKSDTTLEREWGRLRRGNLMQLVRATNAPGHSPLEVELLRAIVEAGEIRASDLASRLFVTKTSISRYVNDMLSEGLLPAARSFRRSRDAVVGVGRRSAGIRRTRAAT